MKNKRPLVPSFLQKLDDDLLRNKPVTWSARTHLVLYFAALFSVLLSLFCYLAFFDAKQYNNLGGWITFIGLIAFIGFVAWLIFLLRFNVFKRYGNWFAWDGLKSFGLYFISIGAMVAVCFLPSAVESFRANQVFGNDEIIKDINDINMTTCRLEYNLLPHEWIREDCKVVPYKLYDSQTATPSDVATDTVTVKTYEKSYRLIDTAELRTKIANADSVVKISDTMYSFFECPDYQFVSSYGAGDHSTVKQMHSKDIYYAVLKNYNQPDRAPLLKKMEAFKIKYAARNKYSYYESDDYYNADTYDKKIGSLYSLRKINNGIDNIVAKKYAWVDEWQIYLRVFYYITLLLTLLVFIFRHSTVKTFFLSLLTALILFIFTGIMMLLSHSGDETSVYSFIILYYVICSIIAFSSYGAKVRRVIQGIGINLCLFMTPFIPLVFVALNHEMQMKQYYDSPAGFTDLRPDNNTYYMYLFIAEIAGLVLILVSLEFLFRKLYRKWYAAAED
jgi:hypothetical protein